MKKFLSLLLALTSLATAQVAVKYNGPTGRLSEPLILKVPTGQSIQIETGGTLNGAGTFNFASGIVTLPASVGGLAYVTPTQLDGYWADPSTLAAWSASAWRTDLSISNVDNTSDINKPVSTATQTALNLKANLASPTFTGTPAAPTAAVDTSTTQVATTAYVVGQGYLKTNGSGANLTALNATQLTSGTLPDARFPATLPASSGINLTALNASNLGSGTVPTGRLYTTAAGYNIINGATIDAWGAVTDSAGLRGRLSDEVGTGVAYFVGGALGTPASGTLTNATGLPIGAGTTGTLAIDRGGTGQTTASAAFGALKQDATTSATGVVELATTAESLAGTAATVNTVATAETRHLQGDLGRAVADLRYSDGATPNRRDEWQPGAAGAVAGMPATFWAKRFRVPASNPTPQSRIIYLGSSSAPSSGVANSFWVNFATSGGLEIRQEGAIAGTDYRQMAYAAFRSDYSGVDVDIVVSFPSGDSTTNPTIWINGVDKTASFTLTTGGTPPNWMPTTLVSMYFLAGYNWPAGTFGGAEYGLGAWTGADALRTAQTGQGPHWWRGFTGSAVAAYTSDFSAGVDNWTDTDSDQTVAGNVDGVNGQDDWLSSERDTSPGSMYVFRPSTLQEGRRYFATGRLYNPPGSPIAYVRIGQVEGSVANGNMQVVAIAAGTQIDYAVSFYVAPGLSNGTRFGFRACNSVGNAAITDVPAGTFFYSKNHVLRALGPVIKPQPRPDGTFGDGGTNNIEGTTVGMIPLMEQRGGATTTARGPVELATGAESRAGNSTTLVPSVASAEERHLLGDIGRAVADTLYSDGATGNRRVEWTPGAAGAVAGMPISVPFEFDVPTSNPSVPAFMWVFQATNTDPNFQVKLNAALSTSGELVVRQEGATTTDFRRLGWAAFRGIYSGQRIKGAVVFESGDSATNPKIYINGVDVSASFTLTTGGSVPNWMPTTLDTTKFLSGYDWPAGRFLPHGPILGALTAAEVLAWTQTGRLPAWCEIGTGSAVPIYTANFSAGVDTFTPQAGTLAGNIDGVSDGTTIKDNVLRFTGDGSAGFPAFSRGATVSIGKRYSVRLVYYIPVANTQIKKIYPGGTGITVGGVATNAYSVAAVSGAWTEVVYEYTPTSPSLVLGMATAANATNQANTDMVYIAEAVVIPLGPIIKPVVQPGGSLGGVLRDAGSNRNAGIYTAGITPITESTRGQIQGTLTWAGTHEAKALLADQALLPANPFIESIVITSTADTTGTGVQVGDGDTTAQWVASTTLTAGANKSYFLTLANRFPGSTATNDLKIYVDPDSANFTGTFDVTINYSLR